MPLLDTLSGSHGVGPVCYELNIASSTYYRHREYRQHPEKRSQRERRDDQLKREIQRVYDENYSVYGIRKVWRQLQREGCSCILGLPQLGWPPSSQRAHHPTPQ